MRFLPRIKPLDIILIAVILVISGLSVGLLPGKPGGLQCLVFVDGKPFTSIDLLNNSPLSDTLASPCGTTVIERRDHRVRIAESGCPHRICINRGFISRPGESIVCVPNRIFIVISTKNEEWDGLAQ